MEPSKIRIAIIRTRVEPTLAVNGPSRGFGVVKVSRHYLRTSHTYLTVLSRTQGLAGYRVNDLCWKRKDMKQHQS